MRNERDFILNYINENDVCAEIGVWKGNFSKKILQRKPKKLYLIDPWLSMKEYSKAIYGKENQKTMDEMYDDVCNMFKNDNVEIIRDYSNKAYKQIEDNSLDFIYIDGNHTYEYCKQDLELYFNKVKVGGYITGDDYRKGYWYRGGTMRAVKEFSKNENIEFIETKHIQFVLKKI